jgi:hypothetical protein
MKTPLIVAALLLLILPASALGQDALYDPDPPAGSAFVRVVNGTAEATTAALGERDFGSVASHSATQYRVVQQGP